MKPWPGVSAITSATSSGSPETRPCFDRSPPSPRTPPWPRSTECPKKVRRYDAFRYAAGSWHVERQVIARIETSPKGADSRFVVTNITGAPRWLYDKIYCARGQAENLIEAHKLHLAFDRTSCSSALANQFRLLIQTAAHWLLHTLRGLAPKRSFWRDAQFDTIRLTLIKVAARVTEMATRIKVALPSAFPYQSSLGHLVERAAKLPP